MLKRSFIILLMLISPAFAEPSEDEVIIAILNYSNTGSEEGAYAIGGGPRKPFTKIDKCKYISPEDIFGNRRTIDLNELEPQNIVIKHVILNGDIYTAVLSGEKTVTATFGQLDLERLARGWNLIYEKYCTGKAALF
jgi:hypothetical protein